MNVAAERAPRQEHVDLLRRRAAELARPPRRDRRDEAETCIIFELGDERYAVAAAVVRQVTVLSELTPLPGAPLPLFGITQWRGDVLTVLDVREALGVKPRGLTDLGRVVVIGGPDHTFGILADAVHDVRDIEARDVRPLPAAEEQRGTLLRGITDDGVLVIDSQTLVDIGMRRMR